MSKSMMVNFALAIPTKNRSGAIFRTIQDTLADMPDNLELVVLDNGSEDDTAKVIDSFDHPRYTALHDPRGTHVKDSFNRVMSSTNSDYVILMSDEDRLNIPVFEEMAKYIGQHPQPIEFLSTIFRHSQGFTRSGTGPIRPQDWFSSSFYCSGLVWHREAINYALDTLWPLLHENAFLKIYAEAGPTLMALPFNNAYWYPKELTKQREQLVTYITMDDGTPYWEKENRHVLFHDYQNLLDILIAKHPQHADTWQAARHDRLIGSWR